MQRKKSYERPGEMLRLTYAVGDDSLWVSFLLWEDLYLLWDSRALEQTLDGGVVRFVPVDLGTHSAVENGGTEFDECVFLGKCYYDGSSLAACDLFDRWQQSNFDEEFLYTELEIFHRDIQNNE